MGNSRTRKNERAKIRKKLRSWGMDPKEINLCMLQISIRQIEKANGKLPIDAPLCTRAEYVRLLKKNMPKGHQQPPHLLLGDDYEDLDDQGFKPSYVDPLLTGVARAVGATAKAVRRGKTITKFQHDNKE